MGLFGPVKGDFELAPEGPQAAVLADIVNLGVVPGYEGKPEHKVVFVFYSAEVGVKGNRLTIENKVTLSMSPKANCRKMVDGWRGKALTDEEAEKLDLMSLVGKPGFINVVHQAGSKGGKFANISSIMPLPKGIVAPTLEGYRRRDFSKQMGKGGEGTPAGSGSSVPDSAPAGAGGDDDVPF
jgi:hypothetical protein